MTETAGNGFLDWLRDFKRSETYEKAAYDGGTLDVDRALTTAYFAGWNAAKNRLSSSPSPAVMGEKG